MSPVTDLPGISSSMMVTHGEAEYVKIVLESPENLVYGIRSIFSNYDCQRPDVHLLWSIPDFCRILCGDIFLIMSDVRVMQDHFEK